MLHIFVDPSDMDGDLLHVTGTDYNHMKNVLRLQIGEEVSVSNGTDDKEYRYGIEEIGDEDITLRLRFVKDQEVELPVKVRLLQGLPKADKMEWIVQKCVELGVAEIVPVATVRSVVKIDAGKREKKTARWQTIAEAAAKQSRRRYVPSVTMPMSVKEAVAYAAENSDLLLMPYELKENDGSTRSLLESLQPGQTVSIFIGPEGGIAPEEVELMEKAGFHPISLGKRILRTETAGMAALSFIIYQMEIL